MTKDRVAACTQLLKNSPKIIVGIGLIFILIVVGISVLYTPNQIINPPTLAKTPLTSNTLSTINVNARDENGETALMIAVEHNDYPEEITTLINAGANVEAYNTNGETALMVAARSSDPDIITALLKAGANVNAHDANGFTALMVATQRITNPDIITALIKAGANVNAKTNDGDTAWSLIQNNPTFKNTPAYDLLRRKTK